MLMSDLVFTWLRLGEQHKCRVRNCHIANKVHNTLISEPVLPGVALHLDSRPEGSYTFGVQVLTRRLITAPQKLVATSADTQAVQAAACACLAAAFGTKVALPSVANLLCAPLPQAADMAAAVAAVPARQHALITTLLELTCSGI